MSNCLVEIPICDWPKLRDLYQENWPENHISYYTIDNYIKWFDKDPTIKNIKVYSLNDDWSDGTYLIIDRYQVLFCTLNSNLDRLVNTLCLVDITKHYLLNGFEERVLPAVLKFLTIKKVKNEIPKENETIWHFMTKEVALQFDVTPPKGYIVKPMREENASVANDLWPLKHAGSLFLLKRLIKLNPNLGVFDEKTGELVAWCFRLQLGFLGTLQVKDRHKRKGLGSLLVKQMAKLIAQLGDDPCAPVVASNVLSRDMFIKLGFKEFGKVYRMMVPVRQSLLNFWNEEDDE